MGLVTLADKTQVNLTPHNVDDVARQQLSIYSAQGIAVDAASIYQAFLEAVGRDTSFAKAGSPGSTSINVDLNNIPGAAAAQRVADNVLANGSAAIFSAAPAAVQQLWQGGSNSIVTAADKTKQAAEAAVQAGKDLGQKAADALSNLLAKLPGGLDQLNHTAQMLIALAGVTVVGGATVYLVYKLRK